MTDPTQTAQPTAEECVCHTLCEVHKAAFAAAMRLNPAKPLAAAQSMERVVTALTDAEALIAEELEPADSEPSGVSLGVDETRRILADIRAALAAMSRPAGDGAG